MSNEVLTLIGDLQKIVSYKIMKVGFACHSKIDEIS